MANKSDKEPTANAGKSSSAGKWEALTWNDLEAWAGGRSVSRGRSYQRQGRVRDVATSDDGRLLATVMGGDRYVVCVGLQAKQNDQAPVQSRCTCPVGYDGCKHAVAVVAEYLERLVRGEVVPIADADDPRWDKLADDDADTDLDEDESDEEIGEKVKPARSQPERQTREEWDEKIRQHIHAKNRDDLAELVCSLTKRFPELREEFRERIALAEGDVDRLIAQARKELQRVTSQEAWRNHWNGEGSIPDYSRLLHRLERLVEMGHADAVAQLGREIVDCGMEQLGRSHDEGETAMELARCLAVVFRAVAQSSLTRPQKLLFAIDAMLQDGYDVIGDTANIVLNAKYQPADWSAVADDLAARLAATKSGRRHSDDSDDDDDGGEAFSRDYQRDQISGWLIQALNSAGRGDETLAVYEKEARTTGSYERLVRFLIDQKRYDDGERWAAEGIEKTATTLPGIADNLAKQICDVASLRKRWDIVATHAAYQFFERPSREAYNQLVTAAAKAKYQEAVCRLAQRFLETGIAPIRVTLTKKGDRKIQTAEDWPLPIPAFLVPLLRPDDHRRPSNGPHFDVLIDMAIADKRPDDALRWFDLLRAQRKQTAYGASWTSPAAHADNVAEAVALSHPQRSLEIYRTQINQNLTHANVGAYETVAAYLRKMRPIMRSIDREHEWKQLVEEIRVGHRNRPRFMEILDRLEDRPIVATHKPHA